MAPDQASRSDGRPGAVSLAAMSSLAAWLCGNLYEELVIVPNFAFGDVRPAMVAFREFFHVSNPALFYVPLGPVVLASCFGTVFESRRDPRRRVRALGLAACVFMAALITAWIVIHVNLRLFFGPVMGDLVEARALAREWLVLNAVRIGLVALAIDLVRRDKARSRARDFAPSESA